MGLSPVSPVACVVVESAGVGVLLGECHSRIKEQRSGKRLKGPWNLRWGCGGRECEVQRMLRNRHSRAADRFQCSETSGILRIVE